MKHVSYSLIFCLAVCIAITGCKKEDPDRTVKVYSTAGEVMITANSVVKQAAVGDVLSAGNSIRTGENSMADILFGTSGIIRIQPGSDISIATLMDQTTGDTQIDMSKGRLNVTLAKLKKGDFRVKTGTAVAAVRGTTFRITADGKATRLDVITGAVRVNPVQNNTPVTSVEKTVESNQTMELDEKAVKQAVEEKKEIAVTELKPEEVKKIREEVKDIKPEMLEKLNDDARKEVKEKVLVPDDSADREKEKEIEKKEKERARELLRDTRLRDKKLLYEKKLEKQNLEQQKNRKKPNQGNEGGSPSVPPSVNML
jgi:hypothetical protein